MPHCTFSDFISIFRNFHHVLEAIVSSGFYKRHVHLPPDECPAEIRDNPKLYPYFQDVRATVDGSLFAGHFRASTHARYRCRKGTYVLFNCALHVLIKLQASWPRTSLYVQHLICGSVTSWRGGRGVQQMDACGRMHGGVISAYRMGGTTWVMPDFHRAMPCWSLIAVYDIISRSGLWEANGVHI